MNNLKHEQSYRLKSSLPTQPSLLSGFDCGSDGGGSLYFGGSGIRSLVKNCPA
jgi:hypothetical protein